jgi:hypothetical protein
MEMGIPFTSIQRLIEKLVQIVLLREITVRWRNRIYHSDQILTILESA